MLETLAQDHRFIRAVAKRVNEIIVKATQGRLSLCPFLRLF